MNEELTKEELQARQKYLAKKVKLISDNEPNSFQAGDLIFSADIQYNETEAFIAIDVQAYDGRRIACFVKHQNTSVDYISGYFAFREGPLLLSAIQEVQKKHNLIPSLIIVDGHGLAHPRKFGVACWVGIMLNLPTIGCAKRSLLPFEGKLKNPKNSQLPILLKDELVGVALRSQPKVKPIFVSVGHLLNLQIATEIILSLCGKYRICEPIRRADHVARQFAKKDLHKVKGLRVLHI